MSASWYTVPTVAQQGVIFKKQPHIPAPQITRRDLQLFLTLSTACYLTTPQIQMLFWPPSHGFGGAHGLLKSCQERLRRLSAHGYVRRIRPFVRQGDIQPYLYALGQAGAKRLSEEMGTRQTESWRPKNAENNPSYLRHFLTMNDVRIALTLACEQHRVTLVEWIDDKELKSQGMKDYVTLTSPKGAKQRAAIVPDACFTLERDKKRALFFLELDLGTVTIRPSLWERRGWSRKIQAYHVYLGSEAFQKRYGRQDAQVLTITTTDERLKHLQETTEKVGVGMDFWFTTLSEATNPALLLTEPIWYRVGAPQQFALLG